MFCPELQYWCERHEAAIAVEHAEGQRQKTWSRRTSDLSARTLLSHRSVSCLCHLMYTDWIFLKILWAVCETSVFFYTVGWPEMHLACSTSLRWYTRAHFLCYIPKFITCLTPSRCVHCLSCPLICHQLKTFLLQSAVGHREKDW